MSISTVKEKDDGIDIAPLLATLRAGLKFIFFAVLAGGLIGALTAYFLPPRYTATTTFIPPQQKQSAAAAMLQSLGALSGLAGAATGVNNPADQYAALLKSAAISGQLIDKFNLANKYGLRLREDIYDELMSRTKVSAGKDGLISVAYTDADPKLAAEIAMQYVASFRALLNNLAITEAQQREKFYERQLSAVREKLKNQQLLLNRAGFTDATLRAEPKLMAERYAILSAQLTAANVRLQAIRRFSTNESQDYKIALSEVTSLEQELSQLRESGDGSYNKADTYLDSYRDFKYLEALLEMFLKQYEMAKLDVAMEGPLVQVIDHAVPPERQSFPVMKNFIFGGALLGLVVSAVLVLLKNRHTQREE